MKTSQRQTSLFIEETLTSSQEDSPANHTAQQGSDLERKMTATSGQKCLEQYERFSRPGLWARMFSALLIGTGDWYSKRCKLTWKLKGTKYSRLYFQLVPSTLPTDGIEYGLLLTPSTVDIKPDEERKKKRTEYRQSIGRKWSPGSLTEQVYHQLLPTPTATDFKGAYPPSSINNHEARKGMLRNVYQHIDEDYNSKTSQLNPRFVGEMMGFPPNWTELPFLNGETNQSKHLETPSSPR